AARRSCLGAEKVRGRGISLGSLAPRLYNASQGNSVCPLHINSLEIQRTCDDMNVLFFEVTLLFYFLGTTLFLIQLAGRWERGAQASLAVAGVGFSFHTLALVSRMIEAGHIPLTSMHEALSFFSWALVLVFLLVELRYRIHILG